MKLEVNARSFEIVKRVCAKGCLAEIRAYALETLKLEFNQKTQITPMAQGIDYVGWRFYLTDTGKIIRRLRTSAKKRYKRRLKLFQRQYAEWEIDFDRIKQSLASYRGHLKHGHTWKLCRKTLGTVVLVRHAEDRRLPERTIEP